MKKELKPHVQIYFSAEDNEWVCDGFLYDCNFFASGLTVEKAALQAIEMISMILADHNSDELTDRFYGIVDPDNEGDE